MTRTTRKPNGKRRHKSRLKRSQRMARSRKRDSKRERSNDAAAWAQLSAAEKIEEGKQ